MGRNLSDHSESPIRDLGGSPCRSPSRRERSPVRHRTSHRGTSPARDKEKRSSCARSPKHAISDSQVSRSPSPRTRRLMRTQDERDGGKVKDREHETNNGRRSDKGAHNDKSHSPISHSPSPRSKRLMRARDERETERLTERENERHRGRGNDRQTHRERSRSPSPRAKRLRRAQVERDADKVSKKEHEKNHGRTSDKEQYSTISRSPSPHMRRMRKALTEKEVPKVIEREREKNRGRASDKSSHRERGLDSETAGERKEKRGFDRDIEVERKERRSGRDEVSSNSPITREQTHRSRHRSSSPLSADDARARHEVTNSRGSEHRNDDNDSVAKMKAAEKALETKQKEKPSFELSGKLAAETNRFRGVTLLHNEPAEARKPDVRWRLYVFKAGEVLKEPLYIHRQSCYLFGRERRVADIPTDHPSCSKQHAVIQFRKVEKENIDGTSSMQVKPYLMDLGSTNKTYLNENPIEPQRYYELFEKDTIKFGNSSREYVLLHENSVQ